VALKELTADGKCLVNGLQYEPDSTGVWDLTIGAATGRDAGNAPRSVQEAVRGLLPRELKGFLPTSNSFGTSTFELPSVAFAYERGWRQGFAAAGFPGPDEEFQLARQVLREAEGGLLVDASCGSGLFTRRFVQTGAFRNVVALDYSDSMLQQARAYCEEEMVPLDNLTFVRADIARLPFPDNSVDGIHAGAAIPCWPSPTAAVAEIARVLKPGATFCGTTFLNPKLPFVDDDMQALASSMMRGVTSRGGFNYWDQRALKEVFEGCGMEAVEFDARRQFIFFSMRKPMPLSSGVEAEAAPSALWNTPLSSDPMEEFCEEQPDADECRVYED